MNQPSGESIWGNINCAPPTESKNGPLFDALQVCNGVFFTSDDEDFQFAVHESIAENHMSPMAVEFAHKHGAYLFYDTTAAAVPLNELKNIFNECDALIVSEDSLNATLNHYFSPYMAAYNASVQEQRKIPVIDAPTCLFLSVQLEQARESEEEQAEFAAEQDFNEETDFELGGR